MDLRKYCKGRKQGESLCYLDLDTIFFYAEGFWKKGEKFAFSYPLSTSHSCHDLSKTIKSALTMTLSNLLSTCGYIPSSPMDLCVYSFFKCSSAWSSSTECESALDFASCFRGPRLLKASLAIKIKIKKAFYTLVHVFFHVFFLLDHLFHSAEGPHWALFCLSCSY